MRSKRYNSATLSGEEDYKEYFYVNPKEDKINLGLTHSYNVTVRGEKKDDIAKYLEDELKLGCWIEDETDIDNGLWLLEVQCETSREIAKKSSQEACDEIIDEHFMDMQQEIWIGGTEIAWKVHTGRLP